VISRRVPSDFEPNAIARAIAARRSGELLDLTETNPTRVGLPAPPESAWRGLIEGARAPYAPEPLGTHESRAAVSGYYGGRVPADHIALTASTSEAYAHLFRILGDPGDRFLVPEPSYPLFGPLAALEGVELEPYPLRYAQGRWRADLDALVPARALIVVQPNNPTGSLLDEQEMRAIESFCAENGAALISDEVFADFATREARFAGRDACLTFALAGLSKTCGLPQAKLAWIACSGPGAEPALAALEWSCDAFLSVSQGIQRAAPALLEARHPFIEATRARLAENLRALAALEPLSWEGGWSAVLRAPATRSDEEWTLALLERGVLVQPGHFFDFADEHHLVVSLLPEPAIFLEGVRRIAGSFSS